ncbi:MAG: HNH endonuclease [Gammaproteobacteria bacterium]|nr:HNH endonuclease [Gammaproteobacteria bacterium]
MRELLKPLTRSSGWWSLSRQFKEDNPECVACGSIKRLHVHHIMPVAKYPQFEMQWTNLMTLCFYCHFVLGHLRNWKRCCVHIVTVAKDFRKMVDD